MKTNGRFQWESITSLALPYRQLTALSGLSAVLLLANAPFYDDRRFWYNGETPVTDDEWDDISHAIAEAEDEIMGNMVGVILPHVMADISVFNLLPCDGGIYARSDYPRLYDALDDVYIVDGDSFRVPDLRERFPLGASGSFSLDDIGGESEHTLTEDEMPVHSHTEGIAVSTFVNGGVEAPAASATPTPSSTGFAGGGQPHNNMPPYIVVNWAIVAG